MMGKRDRRGEHRASDVAAEGFIPAIEGLRGVAILAVLMFHLKLQYFSLGWAGVELFFVVSGFLITRILLAARTQPNYFRNFYVRRSLRIFPIYYFTITVVAIATILSNENASAVPYYFFYLQTIPQIRSWFGDVPSLGHTWTLAIEEQFYLLWPLAVLIFGGRKLPQLLVAMIATGLVLRIVALSFSNPYLMDGWMGVQLDVLAAGALVAYAVTATPGEKFRRCIMVALYLGIGGLAVLSWRVGLEVFWTPLQWGSAWYAPIVITLMAAACCGAVGLAAIQHKSTRMLEFWPLMKVGKISYGLYMFHLFVFVDIDQILLRSQIPPEWIGSWLTPLFKIVAAFAIAWLSWRFVEAPLNRLKSRFTLPVDAGAESIGSARLGTEELRESKARPFAPVSPPPSTSASAE